MYEFQRQLPAHQTYQDLPTLLSVKPQTMALVLIGLIQGQPADIVNRLILTKTDDPIRCVLLPFANIDFRQCSLNAEAHEYILSVNAGSQEAMHTPSVHYYYPGWPKAKILDRFALSS